MDAGAIAQITVAGVAIGSSLIAALFGRRKANLIKQQALQIEEKLHQALKAAEQVNKTAEIFIQDKHKQRVNKVKNRIIKLERQIHQSAQILKRRSSRGKNGVVFNIDESPQIDEKDIELVIEDANSDEDQLDMESQMSQKRELRKLVKVIGTFETEIAETDQKAAPK